MGKIYDALNKSGDEAFAYGRAKHNADDTSRNHLDFIRYSIEAPSALNREQEAGDLGIIPAAPEVELAALREVTLESARMDPHLAALNEFEPKVAEQYAKLAMNLIMQSEERPLKRLLISSAAHGDGRTSVLLNLAGALTRAKRRVLVIDTDLNRPSVQRMLGLEAEAGLSDAVIGKTSLDKVALKVMPLGFTVLPSRERLDNAAELFTSLRFRDLLNDLEPHFDFMLFDSGPLVNGADSNVLVRLTDATLLVVRAGKTSSSQMSQAIGGLNREKLFGVVLNRATID